MSMTSACRLQPERPLRDVIELNADPDGGPERGGSAP